MVFNPPLRSPRAGGANILAILAETNPKVFGPNQHPDYDPSISGFADCNPFGVDAWYHPKWGSRLEGTEVNELCLGLEKATKGLGDYIFFRIGDIPS